MNEHYSLELSRKILFGSLVVIFLLTAFSTGLPFYYLSLLLKFDAIALSAFFISAGLILLAFILFKFIKALVKYKNNSIFPFIIILTICPVFMTTKSFNIELFKWAVFEIALIFLLAIYLSGKLPIRKNSFDKPVIYLLVYHVILMAVHGFTHFSFLELQRVFLLTSFFILLAGFPFKKRDITILLNISLFISGIISLYGIMQAFGYDFFKWESVRVLKLFGLSITRSSSTLAQPNSLASYLIMMIPLSFYMVINSKKKGLFILILLLNVTCLLTTFSRAGLGALSISATVIFSLIKIKQKFDIRRIIKVAVVLLVVLTLITGILVFITGTTRSAEFKLSGKRVEMYLSSVNMIKRRFYFGVGPGNYALFFDKYKTDNARNMKRSFLFRVTHAHSEILEVFAELGLFGFLLYLYLIYVFIRGASGILSEKSRTITLPAVLSIGIAAVWIQNIASIELRGYIVPVLFAFHLGLLMNKVTEEYE